MDILQNNKITIFHYVSVLDVIKDHLKALREAEESGDNLEYNVKKFINLLDGIVINTVLSDLSLLKLFGLSHFLMHLVTLEHFDICIDLKTIELALSKSKSLDFASVKIVGNYNEQRADVIIDETINLLDSRILSKAQYILCEIRTTMDFKLNEFMKIFNGLSRYINQEEMFVFGITFDNEKTDFIEVNIIIGT